jgi:hypothetical protein
LASLILQEKINYSYIFQKPKAGSKGILRYGPGRVLMAMDPAIKAAYLEELRFVKRAGLENLNRAISGVSA